MAENWLKFVRDLAVGRDPLAVTERDRRKERVIKAVGASLEWDVEWPDERIAKHARNHIAAYAVDLRLSDTEIREMGDSVVWQLRMPSQSTEA
jgi:hypothetical protein